MAPFPDLIAGMHVQITQNVGIGEGVANGTLGTLGCVHCPRGTKFSLTRDSQYGIVVQIPSNPRDFALLGIARVRGAKLIHTGISPAIFPVFYDTELFGRSNISLPCASGGRARSISTQLRQFMFAYAADSTIYKGQGETLKYILVVDWKSNIAVVNKPINYVS
ncbi:unnamed protein product [Phytophthora fragariaefolia]|uniref:Unnamed protein product n=1 Tax=Phytophthora fragariaefolia TaxID=1490495 RepID=A0A9W6TXT5_9STRA|nr:unnamed protein product [Phytophthora fragariaefolia]